MQLVGACFWNQLGVLDRADLFLTHAGNGSFQEAMWKGVPTLAFPQGAEQFVIAQEIKRLNFGDIITKDETMESLEKIIKKIKFFCILRKKETRRLCL